jgi:pimeloyl-ACP methyl ester carboxylesterase
VTPRADEILTLADGRLLAWAEWGDPRGAPLIFLHPCPGSRMLCPDPDATAAAGVRLITVDRPGYGRSDCVADPTLAGFARDLERLLDHLWLGRVPVIGWGGGGQYAAACAAVLGERVSAAALVATPAPNTQLRRPSPALLELAERAENDSFQELAGARSMATSLAAAPQRVEDRWDSPPDLAARARPEIRLALSAMWGEAFRTGAHGLAADMVAGSRPWGFSAGAVVARTALLYGDLDPVVDPAHGRWWARALPRARLTVRPESGHLVPFVAWADILQAVLP